MPTWLDTAIDATDDSGGIPSPPPVLQQVQQQQQAQHLRQKAPAASSTPTATATPTPTPTPPQSPSKPQAQTPPPVVAFPRLMPATAKGHAAGVKTAPPGFDRRTQFIGIVYGGISAYTMLKMEQSEGKRSRSWYLGFSGSVACVIGGCMAADDRRRGCTTSHPQYLYPGAVLHLAAFCCAAGCCRCCCCTPSPEQPTYETVAQRVRRTREGQPIEAVGSYNSRYIQAAGCIVAVLLNLTASLIRRHKNSNFRRSMWG